MVEWSQLVQLICLLVALDHIANLQLDADYLWDNHRYCNNDWYAKKRQAVLFRIRKRLSHGYIDIVDLFQVYNPRSRK